MDVGESFLSRVVIVLEAAKGKRVKIPAHGCGGGGRKIEVKTSAVALGRVFFLFDL